MEEGVVEKKLTILYGSQTGTAQDVAESLWRESKRFGFKGPVRPMDEYPLTNFLYDTVIVFICSTTGQGEEPDNMKTFWKLLLRKNLPSNALSCLRYCVVGLGDSSYIKFNFVAKRLFKRLEQLGGTPLLPLVLADEQHDFGVDFYIEPFIKELWIELAKIYPSYGSSFQKNSTNEPFYTRWKINKIEKVKEPADVGKPIYNVESDKLLVRVRIKQNTRVTSPQHFQDVRMIKFLAPDITYQPGDVMMMRPKNSEFQIRALFTLFRENFVDLNRKTLVEVVEKDPDMPVPNPLKSIVTFGQLCREYWDLNAIPRKRTFEILASLTNSKLERDKCLELASAEGQEDLYNYCNRPRRTIVEMFQDFPHAVSKMTLEAMFEIMQPIRPRAFSIASSSMAHRNEIHILVAVVKYHTSLIKERQGLCSTWLANLGRGDQIDIWIRKGSFVFPQFPFGPIIMVGPGTGVAPFHSFIMEKNAIDEARKDFLILFFGCRNKAGDFHFKDDFNYLLNENKLTLICAFSRDSEDKVYVQHKIAESGDLIWEKLQNQTTHIFVAGNAKNMPQDVKQEFANIVQKNRHISSEEALNYIETMEKEGRYQTETWS